MIPSDTPNAGLSLETALKLTPAEIDRLPDEFGIEIPSHLFEDISGAEAVSRARQMKAFERLLSSRGYSIGHGYSFAENAYLYTFKRTR